MLIGFRTTDSRIADFDRFKGTDIRQELLLLLKDLPILYDDVCGKTAGLIDILHYYAAFVDFISPR